MNESDTQQRDYYSRTASDYDESHLESDPEHNFAIAILAGLLDFLSITSVLDVGCGTGRAITHLKRVAPTVQITGIEPVAALREIAYSKGLLPTELRDGDATALAFADGAFDVVCAFGVLHHIQDQSRAVSEMFRVARKAVFISDTNIYGQGGYLKRAVKRCCHALHIWPLLFFLKTRGRNYISSKEDGVSYSYSVFDSVSYLKRHCRSVHPIATRSAGPNLLSTASHAAVLGIKEGPHLP
jgi:ubiquinone/menaquinone biosynthesis C-methylase UbiE